MVELVTQAMCKWRTRIATRVTNTDAGAGALEDGWLVIEKPTARNRLCVSNSQFSR